MNDEIAKQIVFEVMVEIINIGGSKDYSTPEKFAANRGVQSALLIEKENQKEFSFEEMEIFLMNFFKRLEDGGAIFDDIKALEEAKYYWFLEKNQKEKCDEIDISSSYKYPKL